MDFGAFGENLIVEGFDFSSLPVGGRFRIGDAELEMTQIGKECHSHCAIYQTMGDCIMPREGVFAEVRKPGRIRVGDEILLLPEDPDRPLTAAVITLSDKGRRRGSGKIKADRSSWKSCRRQGTRSLKPFSCLMIWKK